MVSALAFLVVIAICVLIHEGGHYFAAVWRNVQVHEFAFGMGPKILSKRRKGVIWSIRAFPVGGFVRLEGEEEEPRPEDTPDASRSFQSRKAWERFVIIAGGAAMNIILAWLLMAGALMYHGVIDMETPMIGSLIEGYPAAEMGARSGDVVLSINGRNIGVWGDIRATLQDLDTDEVSIVVRRDGKELTLSGVVPYDEERSVRLWGVQPSRKRFAPILAVTQSIGYCWMFGIEIIKSFWGMLTGSISAEVSGPVGIAQFAGSAAREGFWSFVGFLAAINLNLGLLNLFPIPALDGGRLIFLFGEMLTGRKFPEKWESRIHYVGFVLLMALIVFITWKDIAKLIK